MSGSRKKGERSSTRDAYLAQIVFERRCGKSLEEERGRFWDIERGNKLESIARSEYEMRNGVIVDTVGFVKHPTIPWAGCSPDGRTNKRLVQLKAPRRHVHLKWTLLGVVPPEHRDQMLFELACCPEYEGSDFFSYVDDMECDPELQVFQVQLVRDVPRIKEIEAAVAKFNAEVEETLAKLKAKKMALQEQLEASLAMIGDYPSPDSPETSLK
jgi:hypothetical protein